MKKMGEARSQKETISSDVVQKVVARCLNLGYPMLVFDVSFTQCSFLASSQVNLDYAREVVAAAVHLLETCCQRVFFYFVAFELLAEEWM